MKSKLRPGIEINIILHPFLLALLIILSCFNINASGTVLSDPDHISTGIEYRGVTNARVGDSFHYECFSLGAMAEIRNESRFNQKILPNHNWRGFAFLYLEDFIGFNENTFFFTAGFEHESAHPTMGLNDGNDSAYDKIYDGTYRNINLNSFMLRLCGIHDKKNFITFNIDAQIYFQSRNTPELPVNELSRSEGISGGMEYKRNLADNMEFFISFYDRYIFRSRKKIRADIYYNTDSGAETCYTDYPVINNMNTVSAKTGLVFSNLIRDRKLSVYCAVLYGNIYGFVDSRDKRRVYSAGIEITR